MASRFKANIQFKCYLFALKEGWKPDQTGTIGDNSLIIIAVTCPDGHYQAWKTLEIFCDYAKGVTYIFWERQLGGWHWALLFGPNSIHWETLIIWTPDTKGDNGPNDDSLLNKTTGWFSICYYRIQMWCRRYMTLILKHLHVPVYHPKWSFEKERNTDT